MVGFVEFWIIFGMTFYVIILIVNRYNKDMQASNVQSKNVLFIGLPGAGKTVYFCVSMDVLQRKCNDMDSSFGVVYEEHRTERMVRNTVDVLLRNQQWPENTSGSETHHVSISVQGKKMSLVYKDYAGEAFMRAFGDSAAFEDTLPEATEHVDGDDRFVNELLKDVVSASGIVLVLDASLILDVVDMELSACLFNLLTQIKSSGFSGRLALVFTKADLLREIEGFSVEEAFKSQQPNSFARLREIGGYSLFLVSAVKCDVNDDGVPVPPRGYSSMKDSENVVAPLCWLLGLENDVFRNPKS